MDHDVGDDDVEDYTESILHATAATGRYDHSDDDDDDSDMDDDDDDDEGHQGAIDESDEDVDIGFRDTSRRKGRQHQRGSGGGGGGGGGASTNPNRRYGKEEALYGVFWEKPRGYDDDDNDNNKNGLGSTSNFAAPIFVAAKTKPDSSKKKKEASQIERNDTLQSSSFVKEKAKDEDKPQEEDDKETQEMREEQKAADEYFLKLLEKAKETKKAKKVSRKSQTGRSSEPSAVAAAMTRGEHDEQFSSDGAAVGIGLGMPGMPTSFGGRAKFQQSEQEAPKPKVDPSLAKWEKHTKGIGSKLLSKMGWGGRGGLGSNRRKYQEQQPSERQEAGQAASAAMLPTHRPESTTAPATAVALASTAKPKKGISRPVEVVVRPANMGLGFGKFKEASQLKSNRQIEAEVRGIELKDEKDEQNRKRRGGQVGEGNDMDMSPSTTSSAIPSTDDLLSQQTWKRRKSSGKKNKKPQLEIISFEEMIERQQQKNGSVESQGMIIDMRGPATSEAKTATGEVPLGEELLYNLSFLLNTYENKLYSASTFKKSAERKVASIKSAVSELEQQKKKAIDRMTKLQSALATIEEIKEIDSLRQNGAANTSVLNSQMQVEQSLSKLANTFSADERQELQFWSVLAPTLLSPIMQASMEQWDPFDGSNSGMEKSREIVDSFFLWNFSNHEENGSLPRQDEKSSQKFCESMICNLLVPKIKMSLESSRWNPVRHSDAALDLYEYLYNNAVGFDNGSSLPSHAEKSDGKYDDSKTVLPVEEIPNGKSASTQLASEIKRELILDAVYPKLQAAILHLKPSFNASDQRIDDRLDLWILPWIPHLDHAAILPNLLADCRRKLKGALSYLHRKIGYKNIGDDRLFVQASYELLLPWERVFDSKSLQRLVGGTSDGSSEVLSRLARLLSKQSVPLDPINQDWDGLQLLFSFHSRKFVSDVDFLSVMEVEVLSNWAKHLWGSLSCQKSNVETLKDASRNYRAWKMNVLVDPFLGNDAHNPSLYRRSLLLLINDARICRIFYTTLRMMQLSSDGKNLDALEPVLVSYVSVAAKRTKENQQGIEEDYVRMDGASAGATEARLRLLRRRRISEPTFREVVEECASDKGIVFHPRSGPNAWNGSRQVFDFGGISIYLEGDVVFYLSKDSAWKPLSLDQLLKMVGHG